jgi:hypothetical protein
MSAAGLCLAPMSVQFASCCGIEDRGSHVSTGMSSSCLPLSSPRWVTTLSHLRWCHGDLRSYKLAAGFQRGKVAVESCSWGGFAYSQTRLRLDVTILAHGASHRQRRGRVRT